jgi:hypothetical protein
MVSEALVDFGEARTDVPLLVAALASARSGRAADTYAKQVEETLRNLTGLELAEGTPAETWQSEWEIKLQEASPRGMDSHP